MYTLFINTLAKNYFSVSINVYKNINDNIFYKSCVYLQKKQHTASILL